MLRDVIVIDEAKCDGCGDCVTACAEGAIQVIDGKAKLVSEVYCDGLGACLGKCPQGAITVVKREAAAFDEQAVHQHLRKIGRPLPPPVHAHAPGHACPGSQQRTIMTPKPSAAVRAPTASQLGHWPVQLKLVNPAAPFLAGAEVLLTADCVPVALPEFHSRWVPGRVVVLACPKLDDLTGHTAKLTQILQIAKPRKITVLRMEVPCCGGIAWAAKQAVETAGADVPIEVVTIGIDGQPR